jgi:xanthine dehydrogenase accessory factor
MNPGILSQIVALERRGVRLAVATVVEAVGSVPGKLGARLLLATTGEIAGTVGGAGLEEKVKGLLENVLQGRERPGLHRFELARQKPGALDSICGGSVTIFIELMTPRPHLILFGGGHVGLAVARLCDLLDYRHTVVDDRAEYANRERFPTAAETFVGHAADFFRGRDLAPYSHVYVLGYSHHEDESTLAAALHSFPGPIGLIGSRSKRTDLRSRLAAQGIAENDFDRKVQCPIGLDIHAETPAEIAVAILGEVIRHHRMTAAAVAGGSE